MVDRGTGDRKGGAERIGEQRRRHHPAAGLRPAPGAQQLWVARSAPAPLEAEGTQPQGLPAADRGQRVRSPVAAAPGRAVSACRWRHRLPLERRDDGRGGAGGAPPPLPVQRRPPGEQCCARGGRAGRRAKGPPGASCLLLQLVRPRAGLLRVPGCARGADGAGGGTGRRTGTRQAGLSIRRPSPGSSTPSRRPTSPH